MIENHELERVIIIHDGKACYPRECSNPKGFTRKEANDIITLKQWSDVSVVSIKDEIKKYGLQGDTQIKDYMDAECYEFLTWRNCYVDRNINVTTLPIHIYRNEDYMECLDKELKKFQDEINRPPFVYDTKLIKAVKDNCRSMQSIFYDLMHEKNYEAEKCLKKLLETYLDDIFIVNTLDYSYSFRGLAPYDDYHSDYCNDYNRMMKEQLTFFRVRTKSKDVSTEGIRRIEDIVHLPYYLADKATAMRFSKAKEPCLYLGATSFISAQEVRWDEQTQDLYGSVFVPNAEGLKLKILNLTLSQHLINGFANVFGTQEYEKSRLVQSSILKLYPLVLAISFSICEPNRDIKNEYLISQCLMKVMHEVGIDGIAYLSAQGENEFQYPYGVNLALPAYDISADNQYSKYCKMFDISQPTVFNYQHGCKNKSYINKIYQKYCPDTLQEDFTKYANYDNYLCSLIRHSIDEKNS